MLFAEACGSLISYLTMLIRKVGVCSCAENGVHEGRKLLVRTDLHCTRVILMPSDS